MNALATYIHNLDPVLLAIPGTPLAVRWYGLAYVAGFILGYLVLLQLSKKKLYCVEADKLSDFITWVCILGVLMGGRLGEFFFYWLPEHGFSGLVDDPRWVFRVWEGGMASHGGIIGVLLVAVWYARRNNLSLPAVTDGLAIVCTIGLFFGRVANFINGELYGRICNASHALAMKFPQELFSLPIEKQIQARVAVDHALGAPIENFMLRSNTGAITEGYGDAILRLCREHPAAGEALGQFLTPRYPSQLFEAAGEGLILFAILITLRLTWRNAPAGIFSALFCFLYSAARITCECFKEPDANVWYGITQGQALSFVIIALGFAFLIPACKNYRKTPDSQKN
ncbi:MAG: prolipoprotein diacylglyceryl transferase [Akkermansia sp.]|nr:prolipoprotein diacylglyceryl transferase [Akkermansia sp.]